MFVQIIKGKVADADHLQQRADLWQQELRPGAKGYLGTTYGVTQDGTAIILARFESPEAAQANSERPEQATWWDGTASAFTGDVTFHDCADVDLMLGGGSDMAGFVQVMEGKAVDPAAMRATGQAMEDDLRAMRPDILGGIVAWHGDRDFTQVIYFSSEDDARKGESTMQEDDSAAQWMAMIDGPLAFHDLRDPHFD